MSNRVHILFELNTETMDFSNNDFAPRIKNIISTELISDSFSSESVDQLNRLILKIKGDWVSFECRNNADNYYIKANLIFHHLELNDFEQEIVTDITTKCEIFLKNIQSILNNEIESNADQLSEIIDQDGIIIQVIERGGWGIANSVDALLTSENIKYRTINHRQTRFDGGASGGSEELLLFIASSVASGITWDVMKELILMQLDISADYLKSTFIENKKFKRLRKTISERIGEDHKDLILTEFYNNENEIFLTFSTYGIFAKTVTIICNQDYEIKELKLINKHDK
jgi:hypothetical protein